MIYIISEKTSEKDMCSEIPPVSPTDPSQSSSGQAPQDPQQILNMWTNFSNQAQQALASNAMSGEVSEVLNKMLKLMQNLQEAISSQPSESSSNQAMLLNTAIQHTKKCTQDPDSVSPADIAMLQGTNDTLSQLNANPAPINTNIAALEASNQISQLSQALHSHLSDKGDGSAQEQLIEEINNAANVLQAQMQAGNLNTDQTFLAVHTIDAVSNLQSGTLNAQAVNNVQQSIPALNQSLLK